MKERRRHHRVTPDDEVYGKVKATVPARVVDISPEGVQVEVSSGLRPNVECDLSLPVDDGAIQVRARVLRCRAATMRPGADSSELLFRAGLAFVGLSPSDQETLRETYGIPPEESTAGGDAQPEPTKRRRPPGPIKIKINTRDLFKRKQ